MPNHGGPLGVRTRRDETRAGPRLPAGSPNTAWRPAASVLLGVSAALVGGALAAAGSGLASYVTAGTIALAAAALAAVSVVLNQPDRERVEVWRRPGTAGHRYRNRIRWAFVLALLFLGIEAVAAVSSGSLTLLSDVGHVLADAVGLGMALAAIHLANAGTRHPSRTYGLYRVEIVAALANALLLMGMAGYVIVEAAFRFGHPEHVPGGTMVVVAVAGLIANLVSVWLLRPGATESLNVRGAYLDVVADAIGSVGLLVAGVVIRITDAAWIDPLIGAALGLWILPRAVILGREALRILVQAAPKHVDVAALEADLGAVDGVVDVHQLHIWTLTSDVEVASAHLRVAAGVDSNRVLVDARDVLSDRYHVTNVTLQVECADGDQRCVGL